MQYVGFMEHNLDIRWYQGIVTNFVECDNSIVVMIFKGLHLLESQIVVLMGETTWCLEFNLK